MKEITFEDADQLRSEITTTLSVSWCTYDILTDTRHFADWIRGQLNVLFTFKKDKNVSVFNCSWITGPCWDSYLKMLKTFDRVKSKTVYDIIIGDYLETNWCHAKEIISTHKQTSLFFLIKFSIILFTTKYYTEECLQTPTFQWSSYASSNIYKIDVLSWSVIQHIHHQTLVSCLQKNVENRNEVDAVIQEQMKRLPKRGLLWTQMNKCISVQRHCFEQTLRELF